MRCVIDLETKRAERDPNIQKLLRFSDDIDQVLMHYLYNTDANELTSILAHRLGSLLDLLTCKDKLWLFCEKVIKRQAHLE